MNKNIEIEFKSKISEAQYIDLLKRFGLENNVFKQVNYYFDTDNQDLNKMQIVLRIRQKSDKHFKVTMKKQSQFEAFENHVLLTKEQATKMIKEGFNTKDFFDEGNFFVTFKTSLDNYRASTPYGNGTLFFDRNEYCGLVDYEIEYEAVTYDEGKIEFNDFLATNNIKLVPTKRKSERALACLIK